MVDDTFRLMPEQASRFASRIDALFYFLVCVSTFFTVLVAALIVYFSIKYRRGNLRVDRGHDIRKPEHGPGFGMEISWMVGLFVIFMIVFGWSALLYFDLYRAPAGAMEVQVIGKQWMWKFQHSNGSREINTLHVPLGQPIKLTMISQDVIHSLFIPAFRVKQDVLPGSYTGCWFEATQTGEFHLFCAEYCGTNHSHMRGSVIVMEPAEYASWLSGGRDRESPTEAGKRLYEELRCVTCHSPATAAARGPPLMGLYGQDVKLVDGTVIKADETYLRESILHPAAKVVAGFQPIMPSYDGQLDEEQLIQLISYIRSLATTP